MIGISPCLTPVRRVELCVEDKCTRLLRRCERIQQRKRHNKVDGHPYPEHLRVQDTRSRAAALSSER
jgi:hypothetical protein